MFQRNLGWFVAGIASALDARSIDASLYLARCMGPESITRGFAWLDRLVEHLVAFPWSSLAMLVLCAAAPSATHSNWLRTTALRVASMTAFMPAACMLAWAAAGAVTSGWQVWVYATTMLTAGAVLPCAAAIAATQAAGLARAVLHQQPTP